jgi:hypothetical protein
VGNLTTALPLLTAPNTSIPALPPTSEKVSDPPTNECLGIQITEANFPTTPYPVPAVQSQPTQGPEILMPTPS